jgi:uncharacterized protein (UPF0210 family)
VLSPGFLEYSPRMASSNSSGFSIRTITAGVNLASADDLSPIEEAARFLLAARQAFEDLGTTVQSTRVATQSMAHLYSSQGPTSALESFRRLDQAASDRDLILSLGPLLDGDVDDEMFPSWAADLVTATSDTYFSISVADRDSRVLHGSVRTAARTILAISRARTNGEANFRFGAAASVPASTPFFPVAHHSGAPAFSIGLESAGLVGLAFENGTPLEEATTTLRTLLEERLQPIQAMAETISRTNSRTYAGIDLSPAPSLEASIAGPIEHLIGAPFGSPRTLSACASITQALKSAQIKSCGYSGLMLPLLEDRVLAQRAAEQRFDVQDLLLYSSVCGTGLDVIALPGDCDEDDLAGLILDMATLSSRLEKPLAARLLPIPGKVAGDQVDFANPHLTSSVVLSPR